MTRLPTCTGSAASWWPRGAEIAAVLVQIAARLDPAAKLDRGRAGWAPALHTIGQSLQRLDHAVRSVVTSGSSWRPSATGTGRVGSGDQP